MGTERQRSRRRTSTRDGIRACVGLTLIALGVLGVASEDGLFGLPVEWVALVVGGWLLGTALLRICSPAAPDQRPSTAERDSALVLDAPFSGTWTVLNGPGSAVPSHGTHFLAQTYAVDLLAAADRPAGRPERTGRPTSGPLPRPDRFESFGTPLTAPADGTVVTIVQNCRDHRARRGLLGAAILMLEATVRSTSTRPMVGNHLVIETDPTTFVLMAHLQRGSVTVAVGDRVRTGQQVARCGNSGNSSQPHLHLQAMDAADPRTATGVPFRLRTTDAVIDIPPNGELVTGARRDAAVDAQPEPGADSNGQ